MTAVVVSVVVVAVTAYVFWHAGAIHGEDRARRRYRLKRQLDNIRRQSTRSQW